MLLSLDAEFKSKFISAQVLLFQFVIFYWIQLCFTIPPKPSYRMMEGIRQAKKLPGPWSFSSDIENQPKTRCVLSHFLDCPQFWVRNLSPKAVTSPQVMTSRKGNPLKSLDVSCILMYQRARTCGVKSKFTFECPFPQEPDVCHWHCHWLNFKVTCPFIWGPRGYYMLEQ